MYSRLSNTLVNVVSVLWSGFVYFKLKHILLFWWRVRKNKLSLSSPDGHWWPCNDVIGTRGKHTTRQDDQILHKLLPTMFFVVGRCLYNSSGITARGRLWMTSPAPWLPGEMPTATTLVTNPSPCYMTVVWYGLVVDCAWRHRCHGHLVIWRWSQVCHRGRPWMTSPASRPPGEMLMVTTQSPW